MARYLAFPGLTWVAASLPSVACAEGNMPQLRVETFASQIFWLVIMFAALYAVISRIVLPQVRTTLRAREMRIGADREQADELRKEAEAAHRRGREALAAARTDSERLLEDAHGRAAAALRDQTEQLRETLERERREAEARLAAAKTSAFQDAGTAAADLVRALTNRLSPVPLEDAELSGLVAQALRERTP